VNSAGGVVVTSRVAGQRKVTEGGIINPGGVIAEGISTTSSVIAASAVVGKCV
jgi:hypothetical protein